MRHTLVLCGCGGRLTALFGGFRPAQWGAGRAWAGRALSYAAVHGQYATLLLWPAVRRAAGPRCEGELSLTVRTVAEG
jgi:hypothetical protein